MIIHTRLLIMVLVILLISLLFYGCVHFEAKPLDASENLSRLEQRSLNDSGLRKFVETNLHKTFTEWPPDPLDFETLTLVTLYFSPDLNAARAKSYEAEAAKISAGEKPNPSIAVVPGLVIPIAADLVLASNDHWLTIAVRVSLLGVHMVGITQGLLATMVANTAQVDLRGAAYSFFNLGSDIAMLLASAAAWLLWDRLGAFFTFYPGATFAALALVGLTLKSWRWRRLFEAP